MRNLEKLEEIWKRATSLSIKRDWKRARKLMKKFPEGSEEYFSAAEILASLAKLRLAVERGWLEPKEPEFRLPRKLQRELEQEQKGREK